VDNTILGHSITHETTWVGTGNQPWGDVEINTGYLARIPVHSDLADSYEARSVRYLPGIVCLSRHKYISLHASSELFDERLTQPVGRFKGYGICDFLLLSKTEINVFRDEEYTMSLGPKWSGLPSVSEQRKLRLESKTDPIFLGLLDALGPKNSQDAYHIFTAEKHGCFCFLTMDFRLLKNVYSQSGHRAIKGLNTRIMSPEEFGKLFNLRPISPRLFSYHDASYPVLSREHWPDSKRQKPPKKEKR
jgi:hypothetical protein